MASDQIYCEFFDTCHWHQQFRHWLSHGLQVAFEDAFCCGEPSQCAICMVARILGPNAVPHDMFPGQKSRAADIVGRATHRVPA